MKDIETTTYKEQLFTDAVKKEKRPDRVPIFSIATNWRIYDAGLTLGEALYDFNAFYKTVEHHCKTYAVDAVLDTGGRNPFAFTQYLGSDKLYTIDNEHGRMNYRDNISFFEESDYDALIADPMKFIWSVYLPRKCEYLRNKPNGKAFVDAFNGFLAFGGIGAQQTQMMLEHNVLGSSGSAPVNAFPGIEILFSYMRGIKGLSLDLRRNADKVLAACEALDSVFAPDPSNYSQYGREHGVAFDGQISALAHNIMSAKQFEKFYIPSWEKMINVATKYDKTVLLFMEGSTKRIREYLKMLPKGHFAVLNEQDDIFELKENLPNIAVAGGMPISLLRSGTQEECIAYAKKLVDELGHDGGYIFATDKMMTYPNDAKSENYKAVCKFVSEYR